LLPETWLLKGHESIWVVAVAGALILGQWQAATNGSS
jgi:hypothetical protein